MQVLKMTTFIVLGLSLAACSSGRYVLIDDGVKSASFQSDLSACEQLSLEREVGKDGATVGAVIGGLGGAAESDDGDELGGAVLGAVIGGLIGKAEDNAEAEEAREQIVFNCMKGRGHNVVG